MNSTVWTDPVYETIMRWMSARTGLKFRPDQTSSIETSIQRAFNRSSARTLSEYAARLQRDDPMVNDLIGELTVGETYFFREVGHFSQIRREIIREIKRRRGRWHRIKMWSAACASGEEAYSLAILCDQEGLGDSHILATDISEAALTKARLARYREWSLRGSGANIIRPYLKLRSDEYQLDPRIVSRVKFANLNLAEASYPSPATGTTDLDIILCRNVLIYFDKDTVRAVARRLFDALSEGGWLITASGDPSLTEYASFQAEVSENGVFYRKPLKNAESPSKKTPREVLHSAHEALSTVDEVPAPPEETAASVATAETEDIVVRSKAEDDVVKARQSLERGEYEEVIRLTEDCQAQPEACALHVRALANLDAGQAVAKCGELVERHSLSAELQYLNAILLLEIGRLTDAVAAAQRVVYIDHSLPAAHFLLGSVLQKTGDLRRAQRHFRNCRNLCEALPHDDHVALVDNETAGHLAQTAARQLSMIESALGETL